MRAQTVRGDNIILHFNPKKNNLVIEQITEDVTYVKYWNNKSSNQFVREHHLLTSSLEELD